MNLVPNVVSRQVFRSALKLKKNSPNILFVGGLGGVVVSTVMACRATLKLAEELPQMQANMEAVKENITDPDEQRKAVAMTYALNAGRVMKLYGPSVVVGSLAVGALTGSHVQLTRRNAGLTAAYAAVSKAYDEYRFRVENELGPEAEDHLHRGISSVKTEDEDGKKVKKLILDPNKLSHYAKVFDEYNVHWQKNPDLNRMFIECQQTYANQQLQAKGFVVLNSVYSSLGIPETSAGAVVGWVLNEAGDNFVDFGLFNGYDHRFVNNQEPSIWLDFNVDGVIYDLISKKTGDE